jgi:Tol biopolymer transport system component
VKALSAVALPLLAASVMAANAPQPARLWTPPALATDQYESSPAFSPDGRTLVFFRGDPSFSRYQLFESHCEGRRWSAAVTPSFAAPPPADEADPAFAADGRRLYFVSTRGDTRPRGEADLDIWFVDRLADGHWGEPTKLPEPVNSGGSELLPRPQADGSLLFGSDRIGGYGGSDIYRAYRHGEYWRVENAGAAVNTKFDEYEAEMSRDGKLLIVVADRGDRSHLYPYRLEQGAWVGQPRIVPRLDVFQVGPLLSPAGDRLLFSQSDGAQSGEWFLMDLVTKPVADWPPTCGEL